MSTVKVTNLQNAGSASVNMTLDTAGNATVANTLAMGSSFLRNRIINGDMRIDQRNAGASITPTVDGTYSADRWKCGLTQASKFSIQRSTTAPAGYINSLLVTSLSAYSVLTGDTFVIDQRIEGLNTYDLGFGAAGAQTVTLSFWVRSSLTGTFGGALANSAQNRSYPFSYTISAANTWEQKTVTIAGDTSGTWLTTTGIGLIVRFGLGSGATFSGTAGTWAASNFVQSTGSTSVVGTNAATWYITGVQLEAGSVATPFERRQYGQELALCQRYYETCFAAGTAPAASVAIGRVRFLNMSATQTNDCTNNILFAVPKRATPTMTQYASTGNTVSASFDNFGTQGGNMFATLAANALSFSHWTASAEL